MLQDPLSVLASLDKWSIFKKELSAVLDELAKSPATVAATRTAAADGAGQSADIADEGAGTQCYLSSWKLFGLQLTDSSFRRDFLVQVGEASYCTSWCRGGCLVHRWVRLPSAGG